MARHRHRQGKIVRGRHSTIIEGLTPFLFQLEKWPEIEHVRLGAISVRNTVGRKSKRLRPDAEDKGRFPAVHGHKRPKGGGGFGFKATRWAYVGTTITGIKCEASHGRTIQQVILTSPDLSALKQRLEKEEYCEGW